MPYDPSITQRVREALLDAGHAELVVEQLAGHFRAIETRLELAERDIVLLKAAERERVTDTGVLRIVDAKINKGAFDWLKWAVRAALVALGGIVLRLAYKGLIQ